MSRFRWLGLVLALGHAPVFAHETLPADWCPAGTHPVVIGSFHFTPAQLFQHQAAESSAAGNAECSTKTCGIVDEWFWAHDMATNHCGGLGLRGTAAEDAIAFVRRPHSFNQGDHHMAYRFDQGPLQGECVVCRRSVVTPVKPLFPGR